jgi:hypothetical protein
MQERHIGYLHQRMKLVNTAFDQRIKDCCRLTEELRNRVGVNDRLRQTIVELTERQQAFVLLESHAQHDRSREGSNERKQDREEILLQERDEALVAARTTKV